MKREEGRGKGGTSHPVILSEPEGRVEGSRPRPLVWASPSGDFCRSKSCRWQVLQAKEERSEHSRGAGDEGEACRFGLAGLWLYRSPSPVSCADILPRWGRNDWRGTGARGAAPQEPGHRLLGGPFAVPRTVCHPERAHRASRRISPPAQRKEKDPSTSAQAPSLRMTDGRGWTRGRPRAGRRPERVKNEE